MNDQLSENERRRHPRRAVSFVIDINDTDGKLIEQVELRDISENGMSFNTLDMTRYVLQQQLYVYLPQYDSSGQQSLLQAKAIVLSLNGAMGVKPVAWVGVRLDEFSPLDATDTL